MDFVARSRFLRMSARKVRRVAALVRGRMVDEAIDMLRFVPKRAALPLSKTIKSAAANAIAAEGSAKVKAEDLRVIAILIDGGPILKRFRAVGMGRAYRIRKRTCHLTVTISDEGRTEQRAAREKGRRAHKAQPAEAPQAAAPAGGSETKTE